MKTESTKRKIPKTISIDTALLHSVDAAIAAGCAADFSAAVEKGLRLLLKDAGFPDDLCPDALAAMLKDLNKKAQTDPDKGDKQSNETKFSRGRFEVKDPQIEALRPKPKKPKQ